MLTVDAHDLTVAKTSDHSAPPQRSPKPPRCGCCDQITHHIRCEQCEEPACHDHWTLVRDVRTQERRYLCTLCAKEQIEVGFAVAVTSGSAVLATMQELGMMTGGVET